METQNETGNDVSINTGLLVASMNSRLDNLSTVSSYRCIYRVPKRIRDVNENAYIPRLVSIGPFHHGKPGLEAMEEHKWRHLRNFLRQTKTLSPACQTKAATKTEIKVRSDEKFNRASRSWSRIQGSIVKTLDGHTIFWVSEITEALFRNLIAFEQCHCKVSYIGDYIVMMDGLINTPHDVELLVKHGIMNIMLADNVEASKLFNNLAKEILYDSDMFYYSLLCQNLNAHCEVRWHRWKATLKHDYFNTPWAAISVVAAVIFLVLTFIGAVCSIIQVK